MTKLTCFVLTYNRAKYLRKELESILKQTYKDFELVILDNASTDGTENVVREFNDKRITYIRHKENIGGCGNIQYAFDYCKTDYFIVLHDDDITEPNLFEREISLLDIDNRYAMVSTRHSLIDKEDVPLNYVDEIPSREIKDLDYIKHFFLTGEVLVFPTIMYRSSFVKTNNIHVKPEAGPCADVILALDIYMCGGISYEIGEPLLRYRIHAKQDSSLYWHSMHVKLYNYLGNQSEYENVLNATRAEQRIFYRRNCKELTSAIIYNKERAEDAIETMQAIESFYYDKGLVTQKNVMFWVALHFNKFLRIALKCRVKILRKTGVIK